MSDFEQFCQTIASLRAPDGCPWDREQNAKSLIRYLLEETYEVLEAINTNDANQLKEELGDLLLQVVLQAQLGSEQKLFDIHDVISSINKKMIDRHPHVFNDKKLHTSSQVLNQWEELKSAQNGKQNKSALAGIPKNLPALLKALKVSEKAVHQGFEWKEEKDIWQQLTSEIEEFKQEAKKHQSALPVDRQSAVASEELYLEMGDILFTMVNIARWYKIDPEEALLLTIEKFGQRFQLMEKRTKRPLKELNQDELENLWQRAKEEIRSLKTNEDVV